MVCLCVSHDFQNTQHYEGVFKADIQFPWSRNWTAMWRTQMDLNCCKRRKGQGERWQRKGRKDSDEWRCDRNHSPLSFNRLFRLVHKKRSPIITTSMLWMWVLDQEPKSPLMFTDISNTQFSSSFATFNYICFSRLRIGSCSVIALRWSLVCKTGEGLRYRCQM